MGRPNIWLGLGLLYTPAHPFFSTTQSLKGTVSDTPYMSKSRQGKAKQTLLQHSWWRFLCTDCYTLPKRESVEMEQNSNW
ncbi:hypothetical protein PoB_007177600 [Plakobranchus ocellatus]|uniref:Secreted protein n=1 Tax=Plakobranchus ocellatus TaxID=259542 RepID=A0AAV4DN23_9GAST|nr:hypothetical protein PoB_007177600 [Plakobranchus ocellatus]